MIYRLIFEFVFNCLCNQHENRRGYNKEELIMKSSRDLVLNYRFFFI